MQITEQNVEQIVREFNDLAFAMVCRPLSAKDTARYNELLAALESIEA
jgi:hypothetical protein